MLFLGKASRSAWNVDDLDFERWRKIWWKSVWNCSEWHERKRHLRKESKVLYSNSGRRLSRRSWLFCSDYLGIMYRKIHYKNPPPFRGKYRQSWFASGDIFVSEDLFPASKTLSPAKEISTRILSKLTVLFRFWIWNFSKKQTFLFQLIRCGGLCLLSDSYKLMRRVASRGDGWARGWNFISFLLGF